MKKWHIFLIGICSIAILLLCSAWYLNTRQPDFFNEYGNLNVEVSKQYWFGRIERIGAPAAYAEMMKYLATRTPLEGHSMAHTFGSALYAYSGIDDISACDNQAMWGCYHQVVGSALFEKGLGIMSDLITKCPIADKKPFGCHHGIGHGIVGYFGYTPEAMDQTLAACDKIESVSPTLGCSDGAFMEYNFRELVATSTLSLPRPFVEKDADAICEHTDKRHRPVCTFELPLWWGASLKIASSTERSKKMGSLCDNGPRDMRKYCYLGIGYQIGRLPTMEENVRLCEATTANETYRLLCMSEMIRRVFLEKNEASRNCNNVYAEGRERDYCNAYILTDARDFEAVPVPRL